jgi:TPP-dependent pyruvate/acetoin dehydrogenase alpha subunit
MNLAALWKLPVLFVCENNLYAMGVPLEIAEADTQIFHKAKSYGIPGEQVDGMNPVEVEIAAQRAVEAIRSGGGPYFLECRTYRFRAHSMFDSQQYRTKDEIEKWKERDPLPRMQKWLMDARLMSDADLAAIEAGIDAEIDEAVAFAEAGTWESVEDLEHFVLMDEVPV